MTVQSRYPRAEASETDGRVRRNVQECSLLLVQLVPAPDGYDVGSRAAYVDEVSEDVIEVVARGTHASQASQQSVVFDGSH